MLMSYLIRFIFFAVVSLSMLSHAEECDGPKLTLVLNGAQVALNERQEHALDGFLAEQISKSRKKLKYSNALKPTKVSRSSISLGLTPAGVKKMSSMITDAKISTSAQMNVMKVDCSCSNDSSCWLENDSRDNSVSCQGAECCNMKVEISGSGNVSTKI